MRYAVVKKGDSYTIIPAGDLKNNQCYGILEAASWEEAFDAAYTCRSVPDIAKAGLMDTYHAYRKQQALNKEAIQLEEDGLLHEMLLNALGLQNEQRQQEERERTLYENWGSDNY